MRCPFGPSHLTLKPSKKKTQKQKNKQKKKEKKKPKKKQQTYQKIAFQLSVNFFLFLGWLFKISLFLHLAPKNLNPKNTIKLWVLGPFFLKSCCASRNGHFWTKKPKIYKYQLSFFCLFSSLSKTKNTKIC